MQSYSLLVCDMAISETDLLLAEQLLGRGIPLSEVSGILNIPEASLGSLAQKAEAESALRSGYEGAKGTQSLKEYSASFLSDWPGNPLDLSNERPWLTISAIARRQGWTKGSFVSPASVSSGRPRVDNGDDKLSAASDIAIAMARSDKRLNLRLAMIRAASQSGVTDLNGMMPHLREKAPDLWKGRAAK